jgi:inosose dehydratase
VAEAGGDVLVVAAATERGRSYERSIELDGDGWRTLVEGLDRATRLGEQRGLAVALHPHHGTIVAASHAVARVLESSTVSLCIDTGHLWIGGTDPVEVARGAPERIAHVHLKDVVAAVAARVRSGGVTYEDAVRDGMYRPLGEGDVDITAVVRALESAGYQGWYVLEQDAILEADPGTGGGPIQEAAASLGHLRHIAHEIDIGVSACARRRPRAPGDGYWRGGPGRRSSERRGG